MTVNSIRGPIGLGYSDPCRENFWSAACWFGSSSAQSLGIDSGAATIDVTAPPVSACAGTIGVDANGKWTCSQVVSVNDPNSTQGQLATNGEDFQAAYQAWIEKTRKSANTPDNNTAGTGIFWMIGLAAVAILLLKGGR